MYDLRADILQFLLGPAKPDLKHNIQRRAFWTSGSDAGPNTVHFYQRVASAAAGLCHNLNVDRMQEHQGFDSVGAWAVVAVRAECKKSVWQLWHEALS
ncbi:hypothetical protein CSAL01_03479 [Colletotrichum salicis]|uniref:Uncharacterized protein n=1 Tax=Colletotrichum salicis TaxID=1209931 RepID=A0A135UYL7_9PEZI|nr:hypothetical protein CSAL01_03479 [Colletotrichum salicis]